MNYEKNEKQRKTCRKKKIGGSGCLGKQISSNKKLKLKVPLVADTPPT